MKVTEHLSDTLPAGDSACLAGCHENEGGEPPNRPEKPRLAMKRGGAGGTGRRSRSSKAIAKEKRDGGNGAILLIPHCVLNSEAYLALSHRAARLLFDIAQQYNIHNNGALLASWRYMSEVRGWTSADSLHKALTELVEHELICQTVQGRLPNRASWYGVTWAALDRLDGLDIEPSSWPRGAYSRWEPAAAPRKRSPPQRKK